MDMLSNLPKGAQIENGRARIQIQVIQLQDSPYNHCLLLLLLCKGIDKEIREIT